MTANRLFTVRDIARQLGLPESTVRYYRDAFAVYLPTVGTGRRRRYPAEAIPVLRLVAAGYAQNRPRAEIEHALREFLDGTGSGQPAVAAGDTGSTAGASLRDDLLATIVAGGREREVLWQLARELEHLGAALERQHGMLTRLAEHLGAPEAVGSALEVQGAEAPPEFARELAELRGELARERDLVKRLRRSKAELERRAAEARLSESAPRARRSLLGRLLARESQPRR